MPMQARVNPHVETHQHDLRRPHLSREVDRLEPAVSAVADHAGLAEQHPVLTIHDIDLVDIAIGRARAWILRELQPSVIRDA